MDPTRHQICRLWHGGLLRWVADLKEMKKRAVKTSSDLVMLMKLCPSGYQILPCHLYSGESHGEGELVEASVRVEEAALVLSEIIPRQRGNNRARINAHLDTLGILAHLDTLGTDKVLRKASLLAGDINHLKELRKKAAEGSEGLVMPLDVDEELRIRLRFPSDHNEPRNWTLEGRVKNTFSDEQLQRRAL
ncbi:hypothetical protein POTOM_059504 [Populus tomentosa]|uniref:Uncharacterized protein n=1 Tax=Populus tomentosa TaxID=118781 RepID=A0A8X7XW82_POPTO|nr:hypothetical protein POTOM_059504 [Populus tomentosa]